MSLSPSLPAQSFDELAKLIDVLSPHVSLFQVDFVDGVFVPSTSWPFTNPDVFLEIERLHTLPQSVSLEIDLMVMYPEKYMEALLCIPQVSHIIVHLGSTEVYTELVAMVHQAGRKIGFAFTSGTPRSLIDTYVPFADYIQVMGIKEVGKQGQPFDPKSLTLIRDMRKLCPTYEIVVDGAVNDTTVKAFFDAGATRCAPGSYIAKSEDPLARYKHLEGLL